MKKILVSIQGQYILADNVLISFDELNITDRNENTFETDPVHINYKIHGYFIEPVDMEYLERFIVLDSYAFPAYVVYDTYYHEIQSSHFKHKYLSKLNCLRSAYADANDLNENEPNLLNNATRKTKNTRTNAKGIN